MPAAGPSVKDRNRAIRAEDLRERIRNSGMLTRVIDNIDKMQKLAEVERIDPDEGAIPISTQIHNLQMVNNQAHKLLDKVIPQQKEIAIEGELKLVAINLDGLDHADETNPDD